MPRDQGLTAREQEILALVAQGYENKNIACRLNITIPTVQNHLRHIYAKLHVPNRTAATFWYWQQHSNQKGGGQPAARGKNSWDQS
jgi:DNA-binding CsgD family transcriptional regulator